MFIVKNAWIGGEAIPHQDWIYQISEPDTVWGIWVALDDATIENGCLWGVEGSHNVSTPVTYFMKKRKDANGNEEVYYEGERENYDISKGVPFEAKKGDAVLLHSHNCHYAFANKSDKSWMAFTMHFMDAAVSKWHPDNWLQRTPENPFRRLY